MKANHVLLFLSALSASVAGAADVFWVGPEGGDWWRPNNWEGGNCPGETDRVVLSASKTDGRTISLTNADAVAVSRLYAQTGDWTLKVKGVLSLPGDWDSPTVWADGNSSVTLDGGVVSGVCYRASRTAWIRFRNCVNRETFNYRRETGGTAPSAVFESGVHRIRTLFMRKDENYEIRGGDVMIGSLYGQDMYGEGLQSTRATPVTVTGGRLMVDGLNPLAKPTGAPLNSMAGGILASGNAIVRIVPGGASFWLADRNAKTWRVSDRALFTAAGPYMATGYNSSTATIEVVGGRFRLTSSLGGMPNASTTTDGRRSELILNGGVLDCDYAASGDLAGTSAKDDVTGHFAFIGSNGGRVRNRNNVTLTVTGALRPWPGDEADGGLLYDGLGPIALSEPSTYAGGTTVRANVRLDATAGALGAGSVTVRDGGALTVAKADTALPKLTFAGQGVVAFLSTASSLTVPSLTWADAGGALVLSADVNHDKVGVTGGFLSATEAPARRTDGLFVSPVFLDVPGYDNSAREMHLATWDETNGRFVGMAYTSGWEGMAYVSEGGNITSDQSVDALVLRATVNGMSAMNKIHVGNGVDAAYVCLNGNSRGQVAQLANTRLVFGAAPGIIAVGSKVSGIDSGSCIINGFIDGTAGVTFVGSDASGLRIDRPQAYTGGTKVYGGEILLSGTSDEPATLGSDRVEVSGGECHGGCVRFKTVSTQMNDFAISGFGTGGVAKKGVLSFEANTTLTGQITLVNDARICASNDVLGTFAKPIAGTGDLYLGGEGTLVVPGVDLAGDVHVEGNVTTTGALLTGERFLFVDGTLTFANAADITVDAKVLGSGKIVLAGDDCEHVRDGGDADGGGLNECRLLRHNRRRRQPDGRRHVPFGRDGGTPGDDGAVAGGRRDRPVRADHGRVVVRRGQGVGRGSDGDGGDRAGVGGGSVHRLHVLSVIGHD